MREIKILKPGLLTSVQDLGRLGYQGYGMSVAGSMDHFSTRLANLLVGNNQGEAVLETTIIGPEIQFSCHEIISITGANMNPKINGAPVPMWTSLLLDPGDILSFSNSSSGIRSYIGFSSSLDLPLIMKSKSTYLRGNIGGFQGRKLAQGDRIPLGNNPLSNYGSYLPLKFTPTYKEINEIRLVLGPQDDYFSKENLDNFFKGEYTITPESDRMGYRLDGPKINHLDSPDIISDGINFGAIQVPGNRLPIIMMADRQTTGGYAKIANVISPDLNILGQMKAGDRMTFKKLDIEEAQTIYLEYENKIDEIKTFISDNRFDFAAISKMNFRIGEKTYTVSIREI